MAPPKIRFLNSIRYKGNSKVTFLDQVDVCEPLPLSVDKVLDFIKKHTTIGFEIKSVRRKEVFQYPPQVIREAVINAIVHADYSVKGSSVQVAIFDNRIEITNPGALPFGLSLETALSGFSQLRNKVIGKVFRELNLIEHWGTGLSRMKEICLNQGITQPKFEEIDHYFKVTLYQGSTKNPSTENWEVKIITYLNTHKKLTAKKAQKIWGVSSRTTSTRLKKMIQKGLVVEISTGPYDPFKTFVLP